MKRKICDYQRHLRANGILIINSRRLTSLSSLALLRKYPETDNFYHSD